VIGVAGAVAVGKSTSARALAGRLVELGRRVDVVATDAFLFRNAELASRDLIYRKGFPETYDWKAVVAFVGAVKAGANRVEVPVYSHTIYDIVPGETVVIADPDVVILEGVVALQPRVAPMLDAGVYVEAAEDDVRRWFADRFLVFVNEARMGAESFYKMFADMSDEEVRGVADGTWDGVNGPNLHEYIEATRANATIVVQKGSDHEISSVREVG
jgi:type I pantothenate kinase